MGICVDVVWYEHLHPIPNNPFLSGLVVGQCEHTIKINILLSGYLNFTAL